MASALHCVLYARCGALGAQPNGPYGYIRGMGGDFRLLGKVALWLDRKAYRRLCDVGPSGGQLPAPANEFVAKPPPLVHWRHT